MYICCYVVQFLMLILELDTSYHKKIFNSIHNEFLHSMPNNKLYNTMHMTNYIV